MDILGLLKFWRNLSVEATAGKLHTDLANSFTVSAGDCGIDDEDSFFELVFTAPDSYNKEEIQSAGVGTNESRSDENNRNTIGGIQGSPSDVFSKRRIVPVEPNTKAQSPASLSKSPPNLRVFRLGFKRSKSEKVETGGELAAPEKEYRRKSTKREQKKRLTVKCKVEEIPIVPLFAGDSSLRSKLQKEAASEDSSKRFSKVAIQKYLKLIKPLYFRASKRNGEKTRSSDHLSQVTPTSSPIRVSLCSPRRQVDEKEGSLPAGLRVVCKHLGRSRSASSSVGIMPSPANRRDDSLLLQHDGIQSAILHCKRSYNSSKEFTLLSQSSSHDPSYKKAMGSPRSSF